MASQRLLVLNAGSSSLKFAVFTHQDPPRRESWGAVTGVASEGARLEVFGPSGRRWSRALPAEGHAAAFAALVEELQGRELLQLPQAVAHRIVHGGTRYQRAERIDDALVQRLQELTALDPDHLPAELAVVRAVRRHWPDAPQVACFDTAFFHDLPRVARLLPIPYAYEARGVRRYGFHGLSYTYLLEALARLAGPHAAQGRVVLAHLGAGSSLTAAHGGRPVDTTMGFTPTSGVMMATRCGDLDPGVLLHLARVDGLDVAALDRLVNRESGLLGVSGRSPSMRELLAREADDARAADAVALYCHHVKKAIGALSAVLGGLDTLVFSGGIGEHSAQVRARVAEGLAHLGVRLDPTRNAAHAPIISAQPDASVAGRSKPLSPDPGRTAQSECPPRCVVRVIATDEESVIARQSLDALFGNQQKGQA